MLVTHLAFATLVTLGQNRYVEPWSPSNTSLPKEFIQAVNFALQHGMADPRGGELSSAKVKISSRSSGELTEVTVKGWVLPSGNTKPTIVLSNGLMYNVESVIGPADFRDDKDSFLDNYIARQQQDSYALIANLALTGNIDLAEAKYFDAKRRITAKNDMSGVALAYLSNRYLRAVEAHMRGDDQLALSDSLAIQRDCESYQKQCPNGAAIFEFLQPLPNLIDESRRRLSEPNKAQTMDQIARLPQTLQIPALISILDEVNERQMSQPGSVDLGASPIICSLVAHGNDAIPYLMKAIDEDNRLTRSVGFGRDFDPRRSLLSVKQAATTAIREILQFRKIDPVGEQVTTVQLQKFLNQYGMATPQERWYRILADDGADVRQWQEAVSRILSRSETVSIAGMRGFRETTNPMHGEILRTKKSPSITDLLTKRTGELIALRSNTSFDAFTPVRLSVALDSWDPNVSLPTLQLVSRQTMDRCANKNSGSMLDYGAKQLVAILKLRLSKGDETAFTDYAQFLREAAQHVPLTSGIAEVLTLLIENQENPSLKGIAEEVFFDNHSSRWNLAKEAQANGTRNIEAGAYKIVNKITVVRNRQK